MCKGALISKFAVSLLPILAEFCFLFLLVGRLECLILESFFSYWRRLSRKGKLLSAFTFIFKRGTSLEVCGRLELWSKAVEGVAIRHLSKLVAVIRGEVIHFERSGGGLGRNAVGVF